MANVIPVIVMRQFGPEPMDMECPNCKTHIKTVTSYKIGALTWIVCIFVCVCALCCDCTKDVEHRCPSCNTYLAFWYTACGLILSYGFLYVVLHMDKIVQ